jgi:hypothetical protein
MFKIFVLWIFLLFGTLLNACSDSVESAVSQNNEEGIRFKTDGFEWLEDILNRDRKCLSVHDTQERKKCYAEKVYKFSDGHFGMNGMNDETILVAETGIDPITVLRFRKRVKENFEFKEGELIKSDPSLLLPSGLIDILKFFNKDYFQSSAQTEFIKDEVMKVYRFVDKKREGHNAAIMGSLIEHNPQNPILTLKGMNEIDMYGKTLFCGLPHTKTDFHQKTLDHILKLKQMLSDYGVRYMNFSSGTTSIDLIRKMYQKHCGKSPSINLLQFVEDEMTQIFEIFGNDGSILFVHSASDLSSISKIDRDTTRFPYRVRVGVFNSFDSDLDEEGVDQKERGFYSFSNEVDPYGAEADVYVNLAVDMSFDYRPGTFLTPAPWLGFGLSQINNVPSTSDAAPLALSSMIYIREHFFKGQPFNGALIDNIKEKLIPEKCDYLGRADAKCIFQDPSKHKHMMVFKLGYR